MARMLHLYHDGCNGLKKGPYVEVGVHRFAGVPADIHYEGEKYIERNPGVYENDEGMKYLIVLD